MKKNRIHHYKIISSLFISLTFSLMSGIACTNQALLLNSSSPIMNQSRDFENKTNLEDENLDINLSPTPPSPVPESPNYHGTELGNPGKSLVKVTGNMLIDSESNACLNNTPELSARFIDAYGKTYTAPVKSDGSFETHLPQNEFFEVKFGSPDLTCGYLTYNQDHFLPTGYHMIIDSGSKDDIQLGQIDAINDDLYFTENDIDITESLDKEGENYDLNLNGYVDYFLEEEQIESISECEIIYSTPFNNRILKTCYNGHIDIKLYTSDEISKVDLSKFKHNSDIKVIDYKKENSDNIDPYLKISIQLSDPSFLETFSYSIENGLITCRNGQQNTINHQLYFRTINIANPQICPVDSENLQFKTKRKNQDSKTLKQFKHKHIGEFIL